MSTRSEENYFTESKLPLILTLNGGGEPIRWINYEKGAYYYTKNKVLWSMGSVQINLHGGTNSETGTQSILKMDTIIAVDFNKHVKRLDYKPTLTNRTLFERDKYLCAYCGKTYAKHKLTRDHIIPLSAGGKDVWENCVTSCYHCNQWKGAKDLHDSGLQLLYIPYVPSFHEHLILQNRRILADQMEFLLKGVSKNSRLLAA
jgi:hypothetical protein